MSNLFVNYNINMNTSILSNIAQSNQIVSTEQINNDIFSLVVFENNKYIVKTTGDIQNVFSGDQLYAVSIEPLEHNLSIVNSLKSLGYEAYLPFPETCHYIIYVSINSINSVSEYVNTLNSINSLSGIPSFNFDGITSETLIPNDAFYSQQWYLNTVKAPAAWDITTGSPNIRVAVLDTGVCSATTSLCADLRPKLVPGASFITAEPNTFDGRGHGTQCAHIIGAVTNNAASMAGIAWACTIAPVKVLSSGGSGTWSATSAGILWSADNNCDVLSMSLGGSPQTSVDPGVVTAIDYAIARNCVIVVAAGNSGPSGNNPPANCSPVISVGAINSSSAIASFSSFQSGSLGGRSNNKMTVVAPGQAVPSINHLDSFANLNGTSFACPIVAGCCALIKSINKNLTHNDIKRYIEQSASSAYKSDLLGYGTIDIEKALRLSQASPTPTPTSTSIRVSPTPTPSSLQTTPAPTSPAPTPTRNNPNNPCPASSINICLPKSVLRANPSANKICFRVGGTSCCNIDGSPLYSNEVCVDIPPPPPPPPSATPGPCIPSVSNGPFRMEIAYESSLQPGSIPCGQGSHICNRTIFDIIVNGTSVGTANLNNANDGGSRSSSVTIPTQLITGSSFTFEIRCTTSNCHRGVAIVRIFDKDNTRIYQSCLSNDVVFVISECPSVTPTPSSNPCGSSPALPISVYRTGGLAFNPFNAAGCVPSLVGQINTINDSVIVSWSGGSTYSSVETQAVDACGRCVYSANNSTNGSPASITVSYNNCRVGHPFVNLPPWCNNPMCP